MFRFLIGSPFVWFGASVSAVLLISLAAKPGIGMLMAPTVLILLPMMTTYRASPFEAALPVSALRISMLRLGIALTLVWLPIVAWMAASQMHGEPAAPAMFDIAPVWQLVVLAAATLLTLLPHAIQPGVLKPPLPRLLPGTLVAVASACGIGILLGQPMLLFGLLTLGSVITFAFLWYAMPPSFQLAPRAVSGAAPRIDPSARMARPDDEVRWWRPILRSTLPLRTVGVAALVGFNGIGDSWLFWFVIFEIGNATFTRFQSGWMQTLPIPRRALLGITLVPFLLPLLGVLLIGKIAMWQIPDLYADLHSIDDSAPHAFSRAHDFDKHTKVPLAFWQPAPDKQQPVIRAPWGETGEADHMSVLGWSFYNPYSARTQSSERFREWQFGRATTAVYGRPLSLAEYDAEEFVPLPRVTSSPRMYVLGGALTLTFTLLIAWAVEFSVWQRLGRRPRLQTAINVTVWLLGFVFPAVVDLYYLLTHSTVVVIPLVQAWLLPLAYGPVSTPALLIGALLPVITMYGLLQWQFNRSEWNGSSLYCRR